MLMRRYKIEAYMKYVFGLAAISLAVPFLFHLDKHADKNGRIALRAAAAWTQAMHNLNRAVTAVGSTELLNPLMLLLLVRTDLAVQGKAATPGTITLEGKIQLVAFCLFEVRPPAASACS
jgi:hypothetical protein